MNKWDKDFLSLARFWADLKSKDPSTKVGAVIVSEKLAHYGRKRNIVGMGYNGFPVGVEDQYHRLNDRPTKYQYVVHAELNAILNATGPVQGCTLYCTMFTCNECAKAVIQAGIRRVVAPKPAEARWQSSYDIALTMYAEAGVTVDFA